MFLLYFCYYTFARIMAELNLSVEEPKPQKRIICFGSKKYDFTKTHYYYNYLFTYSCKEDQEKIIKGNHHYDIVEMNIEVCYDNQNKEFYNHCSGMKENIAGDLFWDTEYTLDILRSNNVPESEIPDFILNYKDIERRFLEGDTSTYENAKRYPTYYHTLKQLFSDLPDLVDF